MRSQIKVIKAVVLALFLLLSAGNSQANETPRIIAIGDIHGDYQRFIAVLQSNALINDKTQLICCGHYKSKLEKLAAQCLW